MVCCMVLAMFGARSYTALPCTVLYCPALLFLATVKVSKGLSCHLNLCKKSPLKHDCSTCMGRQIYYNKTLSFWYGELQDRPKKKQAGRALVGGTFFFTKKIFYTFIIGYLYCSSFLWSNISPIFFLLKGKFVTAPWGRLNICQLSKLTATHFHVSSLDGSLMLHAICLLHNAW